jgi:SUMO ligase MMS21 Smc5/6 complex component
MIQTKKPSQPNNSAQDGFSINSNCNVTCQPHIAPLLNNNHMNKFNNFSKLLFNDKTVKKEPQTKREPQPGTVAALLHRDAYM